MTAQQQEFRELFSMTELPMILKALGNTQSITVKMPINRPSREHVDGEISKIRNAVIPICGEDKTMRPRLLGSGVLIDFAGQTILATAFHVLDDNLGVPLFTFDSDGVAMSLQGACEISVANDLAVKLLSQSEAQSLSHRCVIPQSMIAPSGIGAGQFYASVVGYPASASKRPEKGYIHTPMEVYSNFGTELIGGRISVLFDRKEGAFNTNSGHGHARKPTGKSGGAIFGFPVDGRYVLPWSTPRLMGISTRWKMQEGRIEGAAAGPLINLLRSIAPTSASNSNM